jgi:bacillithiol synthase
METTCLRHTELPHTSRLFADFLYHYDRVSRFYELPGTPAPYPEDRRAALVAALREQNPGNPSLDVLAQRGAVAYVTGQQVGIYTGPAYSIYKAMTAVRLAEESTRNGVPAVPVFWLATEDHDFAEVNHAWTFDATGSPRALRVDGDHGVDRPVGGVAISDWPNAELRESLKDFPFVDDVMRLVEETHTAGRTMGEAFRLLVERLLGKYGILYLDPLAPAIRKLGAPLLRSAFESAADLKARLLARNKELADAGYHAQVHIEANTSLFFVLEEGRRVNLKRRNDQDLAELVAHAEDLSPNAILRPVVQDYLLPTAAYVGGPAEIAYFAQSQVLYEALLGRMPRIHSRSGFTLFDTRAAKLMDRYQLRLPDLFHGEHEFLEYLATRLVPSGLQSHFESTTASVAALLDSLGEETRAFDPTLNAALAKSRAKILYQLTKTQAKVARETLRRSDRAKADAAYLYGSLLPQKHLQERFYGILPFLAKHGFELLDTVYEHVKLDCPDHILLTV